jgi:hypothetical protein
MLPRRFRTANISETSSQNRSNDVAGRNADLVQIVLLATPLWRRMPWAVNRVWQRRSLRRKALLKHLASAISKPRLKVR